MFTHNSKLADGEPSWGSIDKTALPRIAFADMGDPNKKSTWKYPHHWVKGGTKKDKNGVWVDGTLYLHKGGLNAAWQAANGARSGKQASQAVKNHLRRHRNAIGAGATKALIDQPWLIEPGWLETIYDIANREGDFEALAAKAADYSEDGVEFRDGTAIIAVRGPIFRYANLFTEISGATSTEMLARNISDMSERQDVKRIILDFDSPGGQVTGISELADLIHEISDKKEVVAYVSGAAASAAYWLASATSKIVAADTAIVGSIGVVATFTRTKSDDIEIVSSNAPNKRVDPSTDEGKGKIQRTLDALAEVFVEKVAAFRGVEKDYVEENFGKGGVLVGRQAIAVKMIDALGTFEQLLKGGMKMEITKETIEEQNPDLLAQLREEARADLEMENKKLKLEVFRKDLVALVGEDYVDALISLREDASEEVITAVAKIIAHQQKVIKELGEAKGTKEVSPPKSDEPDMDAVRSLAKERGISLMDALVEYEKGGND